MDSGTMKIFAIIVIMGLVIAGFTRYATQKGMDEVNAYAERAMEGDIDPEEQMKRIEEIWAPKEPEPTNTVLYALIGGGILLLLAVPVGIRIMQAGEAEKRIAAEAAARPKQQMVENPAQWDLDDEDEEA